MPPRHAANVFQPNSNGLQPTSDGLEPNSNGHQPCHVFLPPRQYSQSHGKPRTPIWPKTALSTGPACVGLDLRQETWHQKIEFEWEAL